MTLASLFRRSLVVASLLIPGTVAAQDSVPAPRPILETLAGMGYDSLLAALTKAGVTEQLKGAGPFTIYAPNNSAFERIPADSLALLVADPARYARVIKHHVLPSKTTGIDMMNMPIYTRVPTSAADSMTVYHDKGGIKVDLSLVKIVDVQCTNGVIHTVHKVILAR